VPGPTVVQYQRVQLPESCQRLNQMLEDGIKAISDYQTAIGDQENIMDDMMTSMTRRDVHGMTDAEQRQTHLRQVVVPTIETLMDVELRAGNLKDQCDREMEENK
jgi:hypothetical protein